MPSPRNVVRLFASVALGMGLWALPAAPVGIALGLATAPAAAQTQDKDKDTIIFKNGRVVQGKILKETDTEVEFEVDVAGIKSKTTYKKDDLLSVTKGEGAAAAEETPAATDPKTTAAEAKKVEAADPGAPKVYVLELEGWFGEDISQTPLRKAVDDAKRMEPDYLIIVMNNDWSATRFGELGDIPEDSEKFFDQIFRAVDMAPVFTEEIPRWTKPPKVVFWVKKAMGGASILPLSCDTIYFASDAKMGGIGGLSKMFGSRGTVRTREKQRSLRLTTAEGIAIKGGHDPVLVRAMARDDYILSVKFEGGKPVYLERLPESPDELLLTDDGEGHNEDDIAALARGEGNDVLTLKADLAYKLGISKGTVDSLNDLLFNLGIARNHQMLKGQSAMVLKNWTNGLENARRELVRLWDAYQEIQVTGDYPERQQARNKQKSTIKKMQDIEKRFEEALNPWQVGVPNYNQLEEILRQIELAQMQDRR
jgi:hypothetical protein